LFASIEKIRPEKNYTINSTEILGSQTLPKFQGIFVIDRLFYITSNDLDHLLVFLLMK